MLRRSSISLLRPYTGRMKIASPIITGGRSERADLDLAAVCAVAAAAAVGIMLGSYSTGDTTAPVAQPLAATPVTQLRSAPAMPLEPSFLAEDVAECDGRAGRKLWVTYRDGVYDGPWPAPTATFVLLPRGCAGLFEYLIQPSTHQPSTPSPALASSPPSRRSFELRSSR